MALALGFIAPFSPAYAQITERAGLVTQINKAGLQYTAGGVDYLDQGDPIVRDARLETDLVGEMSLTLEDGSQLVMPPSSEVAIDRFVYDPEETSGQAVFSLSRGALRMISGRMRSENYRLKTPIATIGVRGTDFTVDMQPGIGLVVTVDEGSVEIRPTRSANVFTVATGEVWICSETECRETGTNDVQLRRASLGPPTPGAGTRAETGSSGQRSKAQDQAAGQVQDQRRASLNGTDDVLQAETDCPVFRIPAWAYRQIGLDPARWPNVVDGIALHDPTREAQPAKVYCPDQVDFAGSVTSFRVLGQAGPGDRRILYFVNTYPGQPFFQSGFKTRPAEREEAKAFKDFISNAFRQHPGFRALGSEARFNRTAVDAVILRQQVEARAAQQRYLISGVTLYRKASAGRTALFAIPSVVTPKASEGARTAADVARSLFAQR